MANVEKTEELAHVESTAAPQGYQYVHIDLAVQKRVVRKLDWNFMPIVVALCKLYPPSSSSIEHS
jgi:hypothetical protein